jgi:signal transduction histidine kinase
LAAGVALVQVAAYDPFWEVDCLTRCVDVEPLAVDHISHDLAVRTSALVSLLGLLASAALLLRQHDGTWLGAGALLSLATEAVALLLGLRVAESVATQRVLLLHQAAALLAVAAVGAVALRAVRTRRVLRDLLARLQPDNAAVLGGPGIRVEFGMADGTWVDASGLPVSEGDGMEASTTVTAGQRQHVRFVASDASKVGWSADEVVAGWGPADWLALDNARLVATTRAHQREVVVSQRRIVQRTDEELRRLAGDLHDGAQQRLVGVKLQLAIARSEAPAAARAGLDAADRQVQDALMRLRDVTHTVFPRLVASDGLDVALADLGTQADTAVSITVRDLPHEFPLPVQLAVYALVSVAIEAATRDGGNAREVLVRGDLAQVTVTVSTGDQTPGLVLPADVLDRIDALGGSVRHAPGVTVVVIPCG